MKQSRRVRFGRWLRTTASALKATFRKKNLQRSFRSVLHGWRAYVCFYLAMLIIGTGFAVIGLYTDAELAHIRSKIEATYDYHIEISGLSNEDWTAIDNKMDEYLLREVKWLGEVSSQKEADGTYTFFVTVPEGADQEQTLAGVRAIVRSAPADGNIHTTPLYEYEEVYKAPAQRLRWIAMIIWMSFSVITLVLLYRVRLEHFRFTYGIYTACGADYPMLFGTAAGEMLAVGLLSILPAAGLGVGVTAFLLWRQGISMSLSVLTVVSIPLAVLLTVLLAVRFPMRRLSHQTPVWMLTGQDVSGLVRSPRTSRPVFGKSFPFRYELYTFWRLRRYYVGLVLSAVLFSALFVSGLYIADMQGYREDVPTYEYVIRYAATADAEVETGEDGGVVDVNVSAATAADIKQASDLILPDVNQVEGVAYAWWQVSRSASRCASHLLIHPEQVGYLSGNYTVPSEECADDGYTLAGQNYSYVAVDELWLDMIQQMGATIEGDPTAALNDPYQLVVSEDIYNQSAYTFKPGDKIMIATLKRRSLTVDMVADEKEVLRQQIDKYKFTYQEYTICAVVHDLPSQDTVLIGANYDAYETLSGKRAVRDRLYIYMDPDATNEEVHAAEGEIRNLLFYGWTVDRTHNFFYATIQNGRNISGAIRTLAILLMLVSPLIWLFSQIMFYRKRREEFTLLNALGAKRRAVSGLFPLAGGVLSLLAFVITTVSVWLTSLLVYTVVAVILPKFHIIDAFHYTYSLSWTMLGICAAVSLICGFLSCLIPYWLLRRDQKREQGRAPGGEQT